MQIDLFSATSLACTTQVPPAPMLNIAHYQAWPFPVFMYQAKEGAQQ